MFIYGTMLSSITVSAQIFDRETKFLLANGTFYQHKTNNVDSVYKIESSVQKLSSNIGTGFFLSKSLGIGFRINYSSSITDSFKTKMINLDHFKSKESITFWGISSFLRYQKKIYKRFFIFLDGNVCIGSQISKLEGENWTSLGTQLIGKKNKGNFGNSILILARPGINYCLCSKIGIELSFGNWNYQYTNFQPGNGSGNRNIKKSVSGFNFELSSLSIGINYYFKSKPKKEAQTNESEGVPDNVTK